MPFGYEPILDEQRPRLPEGDLSVVLTNQTSAPRAEYCRPVAAFVGMASGTFAAAVPQGSTQETSL